MPALKRLPTDAFQYFVGLGDRRTYSQVAAHFGVGKRTVVRRARAERWQARLLDIQRQAAAKTDSEAVESLATLNKRHLRILKALEGKALSALQSMPMQRTSDAVRALLGALSQEREIMTVPGSTGGVTLVMLDPRHGDPTRPLPKPGDPDYDPGNRPQDPELESSGPSPAEM